MARAERFLLHSSSNTSYRPSFSHRSFLHHGNDRPVSVVGRVVCRSWRIASHGAEYTRVYSRQYARTSRIVAAALAAAFAGLPAQLPLSSYCLVGAAAPRRSQERRAQQHYCRRKCRDAYVNKQWRSLVLLSTHGWNDTSPSEKQRDGLWMEKGLRRVEERSFHGNTAIHNALVYS